MISESLSVKDSRPGLEKAQRELHRTFEREEKYENEREEIRVAVPVGAAGCHRLSLGGG